MPLIDDLIDLATHPAIQPILQRAVIGNPREDLERRLHATETRLDEIQRTTREKRGRRQKSTTTEVATLSTLRDQVSSISGGLDEALRFARENGMQHPEAKQRLEDARMAVLELERYELMPQRAGSPEDKRVAQALSPKVRKLRQKILNRMWSVEDLSEASSAAGELTTALQTAVMARDMAQPSPAVALTNMTDNGGYGRDGLSKGCIPCALGHLGMAAGSLSRAATANPTEQAKRVAIVQKELDMLLAYDWVPEKIAKNSPQEQSVIANYQPQVESLRQQVRDIRSPEDVRSASAAATELWESFKGAVDKLPTPMAYARPVRGKGSQSIPAIHDQDTLIDEAYRSYGFVAPNRSDLNAMSEPTNYGTLMDHIVQATEEYRDIQWRTQPLSGEDAIYIPYTNTIIRTAEATKPENYHLQTTIHESAHGLLNNLSCFPMGLSSPQARKIGETEADLVTIATMSELGLPLEYGDGTREAAGDYTIDWQAVKKHFGPAMENRVKWAVGWLVTAAQDGVPQGSCPPPAPIPPPPVIALGVNRPVGTGLEIGRVNTPTSEAFHHDVRVQADNGDIIRQDLKADVTDELQAVNSYANLAQELRDPTKKALVQSILQDEAGHARILEALELASRPHHGNAR